MRDLCGEKFPTIELSLGDTPTPADDVVMGTPGNDDIRGVVRKGLGRYFQDIGVAETISNVVLQGWVALTRAGDYQTPHIHRGANISGVYYVNMADCEQPQGCIDVAEVFNFNCRSLDLI